MTSSISAILLSLTAILNGLTLQVNNLQVNPTTQVAQVVSGSPTTQPLVQASSMVYEGAFRLPTSSGPGGITGDLNSFNGGGEAMAYYAPNNSIFLAGSRCCADPADAGPSTAAEINIPEIRNVSSISALATATYRQNHVDILRSKQREVGCGGPIGGLFPYNSSLIVSVYCYYDAGYVQNSSHFVSGINFSNLPTVTGPLEVQSPATGGGRAGFVSGYMAPIPTEWQSLLGGNAFTGNCCIPIITRTSWGPAVSVFNASDVGVRNPVPAVSVLGYPQGHPIDGGAGCDSTSSLFNCNTSVAGVIFPAGTASVLFFGSHGTGEHCYGTGTADQSLHGQQVPGETGNHYCYDPVGGAKGAHAYPYQYYVWAYNANDLVRVKNGELQNWQVRPYAVWGFNTPFQTLRRGLSGVTYDPATRRVFVSLAEQDAPRPIVHVFRLSVGTSVTTPTTPTTPTPTPTNATVSAWSAWSDTSSWTTCSSSGTQTKTQVRTRTVLTPATNGGTTPSLSETQTVSQGCTSTTTPTTPAPTPTAGTLTLSYLGKTRDVVGADDAGTGAGGGVDGGFAVTFSSSKTLTSLTLNESVNGSEWNTVFNDGRWFLGVATSATGNVINATSLNTSVVSGTTLYLFASDYNNSNFPANGSYTVRAVFSDNTTMTGTYTGGVTTIPTPTPAPEPTSTPSTKFVVGESVQTTANLNVRGTAGSTGTSIGTQILGAIGRVLGGPTLSGGLYWWQVDYSVSPDGWSAETYLSKYTAPTTPTTPTPTNAIVSAWSMWSDTSSWSTCPSSGVQTKTQVRTRTVITPATNGGTTPSLSETQTVSQGCTPTTTPTTPAPTPTPTPDPVPTTPTPTPSTPTTTTQLTQNLYFGMSNSQVKILQNFLIGKGYLKSGLNTGFFGISTFSAVKSFQKANGISATGYVGPQTRALINSQI